MEESAQKIKNMKINTQIYAVLLCCLIGTLHLTAQTDLVQISGSTLNIVGDTKITLDGDWINNGQFNSDMETLTFNGNTDQNLEAFFEDNFFNLVVEKPAGVLKLIDNITIKGMMTLSQGSVDIGTRNIILSPTASLVEDESSGNICFSSNPTSGAIQTERDLNMPNDLSIGGIGIGIISNSDLGSTFLVRGHSEAIINGNTTIRRAIGAIPTNNTDLDATFIFNYFDSELNGQNENELKLFATYDGATNWNFIPSTLDQANNRLTAVNQDQLGVYVVSDDCLETVIQTQAFCEQTIQVALGTDGTYTVSPDDIDTGSTGACGLSRAISNGDVDCTTNGAQMVTLEITGGDGVVSTCMTAVTVVDDEAPEAVCLNPTLSVDANGEFTPTIADLDGGSTDNCFASLSIPDITTYACNAVGTTQSFTLQAVDGAGNIDECTANVSIIDNIMPTALCRNTTRALSKSGRYKPKVNHLDDGSFDNCGIASMSVSPTLFICDDIGNIDITLTVTDVFGNQSSCVSTINLIDDFTPKIRCPQSVNVEADPVNCDAVVDYVVLFKDNCDNEILTQLEGLPSGSAFPIGTTTNIFEVVDIVGLSKQCAFTVTVNDPGGCAPLQGNSADTNDSALTLNKEKLVAFPNPTSNWVNIQWQQEKEDMIQLELHSLEGKHLATLANGLYPKGTNQIQWNSHEANIAGGVYLLSLTNAQGERAILRLAIVE